MIISCSKKSIFILILTVSVVGFLFGSDSNTELNEELEKKISFAKNELTKDLHPNEKMQHLYNIVQTYLDYLPDSTYGYCQQIGQLAPSINNKNLIEQCDTLLNKVTNKFISKGKLIKAEVISEYTLKISELLEDKKSEAQSLQNLTRINGMQRKMDVAQQYAEKGLVLFQELDDTLNYARTLTNLGNIFIFQNKADKANSFFLEALEIYQSIDNKKGIAACYNSLSLVMKANHDFVKADNYLDKAISIFKESDDNIGVGNGYLNKGNLKHQAYKKDSLTADLDRMLVNYQSAYNYYQKGNSKTKTNMALGNIGTTYLKQGKLDKAIKTITQVIKFNEKNAASSSSTLYYSLGMCYFQRKKYQQAIPHIEKSVAIQKTNKTNWGLETSYSNLAKAYAKIGNTNNALKNQKLAFQTLQTYLKENNAEKILDIEAKYSNLKKEKQLVQQSLEIQQNNNMLANRKWGLFTLGGLTSLLGFGLWIYYKRNQKINKLNFELEQKNQFIHFLHKEINHRAKNHFQFISNLLRMQGKKLSNDDAVLMLEESERRVRTISKVYNKLVTSNKENDILFEDYILELTKNFEDTFQEQNLKIKTEIENVKLDAESAVHFGILINELVANAVKHAFDNQPNPLIKINFKDYEKFYHLELEDNGNGVPDFFKEGKNNSFGIQLIKIITEQLKGKLQITKTTNGLNFNFQFNKT